MGQIVGALIFTQLSDQYGRKMIFVSIGILTFLASTLIALSPNYYVYAIMKFLSGTFMEVSIMKLFYVSSRKSSWS